MSRLLFDIVIGAAAIILTSLEFFTGARLLLNLTGHLGESKPVSNKESKDILSTPPISIPSPTRFSTTNAGGDENIGSPAVPS